MRRVMTVAELLKDKRAHNGRAVTVAGNFIVDSTSNCFLEAPDGLFTTGEFICLRGLDAALTGISQRHEPYVGGPVYLAVKAVVEGDFHVYAHYHEVSVIDPVRSLRSVDDAGVEREETAA